MAASPSITNLSSGQTQLNQCFERKHSGRVLITLIMPGEVEIVSGSSNYVVNIGNDDDDFDAELINITGNIDFNEEEVSVCVSLF